MLITQHDVLGGECPCVPIAGGKCPCVPIAHAHPIHSVFDGRLLSPSFILQVRRSDAGYLLYLIMRGAVDQVRVGPGVTWRGVAWAGGCGNACRIACEYNHCILQE